MLAGIVSQEAVPAAARVAAAGILLDRGWGKAIQPHTDEAGGPLRIIIRRIPDAPGEAEPLLIEHEALKNRPFQSARTPCCKRVISSQGIPPWALAE
ncbi:hypothetical protein C7G41_35940 [Bradyrhizobium sp. MOS002]|nr:hypothetical protein C7G41_35940 [Bradyrhizobium sp. MOS002]